jgi:hypothetical protein
MLKNVHQKRVWTIIIQLFVSFQCQYLAKHQKQAKSSLALNNSKKCNMKELLNRWESISFWVITSARGINCLTWSLFQFSMPLGIGLNKSQSIKWIKNRFINKIVLLWRRIKISTSSSGKRMMNLGANSLNSSSQHNKKEEMIK